MNPFSFNPWVIIGLSVALISSYGYGFISAKSRFDQKAALELANTKVAALTRDLEAQKKALVKAESDRVVLTDLQKQHEASLAEYQKALDAKELVIVKADKDGKCPAVNSCEADAAFLRAMSGSGRVQSNKTGSGGKPAAGGNNSAVK